MLRKIFTSNLFGYNQVLINNIKLSSSIKHLQKLDDEPKVEQETLASQILKEISRQRPLMNTPSPSHVTGILDKLFDAGCSKNDVFESLTTNPDTIKRTVSSWQEAADFLNMHGFITRYIPNILVKSKSVFSSKEHFLDIIATLKTIPMSDPNSMKLVGENPWISDIYPIKNLDRRNRDLKNLFQNADMVKIIFNSPIVLTCPWVDVEDKYEYLCREMGVLNKDIVQSQVFSHSMDHLKMRHLFLKRAGLYEQPDKDGKTKYVKNNRLTEIVDTTSSQFSKRIAKMNHLDFLTFQRIYEIENSLKEDVSDDE